MRHMDIKDSFLAVYDEHADAIYRFCVARTGNSELAHDLTQDTFMRFWDALREKGTIEYERAFIYRIARNAIIDWYRKHKSESLDELRQDGFDPADESGLVASKRSEHAHILSVLHKLPEQYREVIVLRYVDALPPREIATILEATTNQISVRLNRAMKALQEVLQVQTTKI
ncbi:RNA polymerase sigma factor [Candidatus Pacebacteria bacterium]|nr:RNA polymerase sigma factor [Candidatus Paceibacterota bacterium]